MAYMILTVSIIVLQESLKYTKIIIQMAQKIMILIGGITGCPRM